MLQINSKFGQTEIIGLLVFILLLFLGVLFVVMNSLGDSGTLREDFRYSVYARSSLNTFLSMTLDDGRDYSELLVDSISDEDEGNIDYLSNVSFDILNETFIYMNQDFHYTVVHEDEYYIDLGPGCAGRNTEASNYPIPVGDGTTVYFQMEVC